MFERIGRAVGFTLIEMAIVLVVVGLLLSGGLLTVAPVIQGSKISETKLHMDRIEQALTLYVIRNGCLPCPADGASATPNGSAAGNAATYTTQCLDSASASATCNITNGTAIVPWAALGLSEEEVLDGWGNFITYVIDGTLAVNATSMVRTPPSTYPGGALVVQDATPTTATPAGPIGITTAAAYVLISHGTDMLGAYGPGGATKVAPAGTNLVQFNNAAGVCGATPCHQDLPYDITGVDHFDDIVRWRSAPMIVQLCGTNACGNPA